MALPYFDPCFRNEPPESPQYRSDGAALLTLCVDLFEGNSAPPSSTAGKAMNYWPPHHLWKYGDDTGFPTGFPSDTVGADASDIYFSPPSESPLPCSGWQYSPNSIFSTREYAIDDSRSPVHHPSSSATLNDEEFDSDSESDSDSDSEAQYIVINPDSPWYKSPHSRAGSPCHSAADYLDSDISLPVSEPCSSPATYGIFQPSFNMDMPRQGFDDVGQVILDGVTFNFDEELFDMVDPGLAANPLEAMREMWFASGGHGCTSPSSCSLKPKPLPDVPIDLADDESDPPDH